MGFKIELMHYKLKLFLLLIKVKYGNIHTKENLTKLVSTNISSMCFTVFKVKYETYVSFLIYFTFSMS